MTLILPGDSIDLESNIAELLIGPGFRKDENKLIATKCGILKKKENFSYWIESSQKRYIPIRNEQVIGIIASKSGESFKVDIGSSEYASLSYLAFENATKRNRPNIDIGDLIYCKILTSEKDIEPELVCIESDGKAHGMGHLNKGFVFRVSLDLARRLLSENSKFLLLIGKEIKFEIAIGSNGLIWLNSDKEKNVILLKHAICQLENVNENEIEKFILECLNDENKMELY